MTNKPTLQEALAVLAVAAVVGETNGTYTAYMVSELVSLPSTAKVVPPSPADIQAAFDAQNPALADLRDQAQSALDTNTSFQVIGSPTNVQTLAQVKALTTQNTKVIGVLQRLISLRQAGQ